MIFDRTNGKIVVYAVYVHGDMTVDRYYYHYYRDAKNMFNRLSANHRYDDCSISLYNMSKDIRKVFRGRVH